MFNDPEDQFHLLPDMDGVENELVNLPEKAIELIRRLFRQLSKQYDWSEGEATFKVVFEIDGDAALVGAGLYSDSDDEDEEDDEDEDDD